ncbi:chemotaxis protein CheB [Novosphingobium sp.]|uniref:chemotaxis protein CheB n=1 Tax=Novosphingobium sp. TaxID=1874826 RepID=UPI0025EF8E75|nr:chemotaxis protein CheB [Novosphingobium sp.]
MTAAAAATPPIIGVGASAGGLEALREVFEAAEAQTGMAFVVVQHLDPTHESLMAQLLERYTAMTVTQASGGERMAADHIYVIPPGNGLAVHDGILELTEFRDPRGLRRPIDDFFESLAEDQGGNAACVILSGTGGDGSRGLRAIKEHGGLAIVQDPSSARYDGMPVSAIGTGLVDIVARPQEVIEALRNFFDRAGDIDLNDEASEATDLIDQMCDVLQETIGHDFSGYKRSTLSRRIARRMQVIGAMTSDDYLARLRLDQGECEALFRDLLINVTRFFRDGQDFARLTELVIDPMVEASRNAGEIRIWVAGCSSGEEPYTLAMLFADSMRRHGKRPYVQIFASDIDDQMLNIARSATYPLAALGDIPPEMQSDYVVLGADNFSMSPMIRDMVRFSLHNVVRDPPYSKIDLLSCRNLLIYFDEDLQRQVIPTFHFALTDGGKLFLGSSETVGRFEDLFSVEDQRSRIYERRPVIGRYSLSFSKNPNRVMHFKPQTQHRPVSNGSVEISALKRIAESYAPVSLLVDAEGVLLDHWGPTSRYLDFPERADQRIEVARQCKPGLRDMVGPLLRNAAERDKRRFVRNVEVRTDFGTQMVNVVADPVAAGAFLLVIREEGPLSTEAFDEAEEFERGDGEIQFLQDELATTRQRLRTTVEELETTNEELKSSNEEMMSMNEELQSTNEELTTVNDELKLKVDQITLANADLKNFFDSTELVVLVVDQNLRLRSFTEAARSLFTLDAARIGKALNALDSELADERHLGMARRAVMGERMSEERVSTASGDRHFILRALPYRRLDGTTDGATLVFTDVSLALALEQDLIEERARLRMALEVARIGVWQYEPSTDKVDLDRTERELLGLGDEPITEMAPILAKLPGDDRDRVNDSLRRAMDGERDYDEVFRVPLDDGRFRWLHGLGRRLELGDNRKFIGVTYDITAEREQLAQRELMIREMNHRVKNLFAIVSSLIAISARHTDDVAGFARDLQDRIRALGRSHALVVDESRGDASLADILKAVVGPSVKDQLIALDGDPVTLPNRMVTPLALVFHEWATNAVKYGALSHEDGTLAIDWKRTADTVVLSWQETGGADAVPGQAGFGTKLVDATVRQLNGTVSSRKDAGSFALELSFPL